MLLEAMRALNSTYAALSGPAGVDAKQAWVISGWGVADPLLRYHLVKKAGNKEFLDGADDGVAPKEPAKTAFGTFEILNVQRQEYLPSGEIRTFTPRLERGRASNFCR